MRSKRKQAKFDITKVDAEHFLEVMKVENLREATEFEFNFSCPFTGHSHGDQSPSAYMNKETTAWMCHGCKRKGNAISFLAEIENITFPQAISYLQSQYGGALPDPDEYSITGELQRFWKKQAKQHKDPEFDVFLDEQVNEQFLLEWVRASKADPSDLPEEMEYMFDRGFEPATLDEWEIGYSEDRDRITIPVRNHEGKLVGFKGRTWNGRKPKYLILGGERDGFPRYQKSKIIFGLDKAIAAHEATEPETFSTIPELILCEGELDVISLHEKGFPNSVCVAGSDFSDTQAKLIRRFADKVTIFFDSDKGGYEGTRIVVDALSPFMPVRVVPDHEGDPNDMEPAWIAQLLDESESVAKIRLMTMEED